ncbi:hypothetical protein ACOMHN_007910 [Nucella lapillus]
MVCDLHHSWTLSVTVGLGQHTLSWSETVHSIPSCPAVTQEDEGGVEEGWGNGGGLGQWRRIGAMEEGWGNGGGLAGERRRGLRKR